MTTQHNCPQNRIYNLRPKSCIIEQPAQKINNNTTKVMRLNSNIKTLVKINEQEIEDMNTFTHLEGVVASAWG